MSPCPCGRPVRLRALKIRVNRRHGITHWIEHKDGRPVCPAGDWSSVALKPYPKVEADQPWTQLRARWEGHVASATAI